MMTYRDTTFCSAVCPVVACHRNMQGTYYGTGPVEDFIPVSICDFSKGCNLYLSSKADNDLPTM